MSTRSLRYTSQKLHIPKGRLASGSDRDAGAFLEAATIYDSRQQRAVYELVRLLKQYGLWSKMKAIYPFVGGTATTHKWNLKDPRDLNAAFRLTFNGGWTHSSTGADPNGTSGYADTYLTPSTSMSLNSSHVSYYSRENSTTTEVEIGCENTAGNNRIFIESNTSGTTYTTIFTNPPSDFASYVDTNSAAFYIATRTASGSHVSFRNATKKATATKVSSALTNQYIYIGCFNRTSSPPPNSQYYSSKECAFASIGDGLTDTEAANLYYAVQRYQQILGRAV